GIDDPSRYTLVLTPDGLFDALADCNHTVGAYAIDGSNLSLVAAATTQAACLPGSLSDAYLLDLGQVTSFGLDGDHILLSLDDGTQMVFAASPIGDMVGAPIMSPDA